MVTAYAKMRSKGQDVSRTAMAGNWCFVGFVGMAASPPFAASEPAALPDAATMLREVEAHQKQLDKMRENYTFRAVQTTRQLDSSGNTKKVETEEHEVFFVNGHRVAKTGSQRRQGPDSGPGAQGTGPGQ